MSVLHRSEVLLVLPLLVAGCRSTAEPVADQLERVAKDWCLTIRASQVLPVYPLTEDLQPGDVFVVNVPLREQIDIYEQRGFLPLDQHVVRLPVSGTSDEGNPTGSYAHFYQDAFLKGSFDGIPADRPGWPGDNEVVPLPRAAFPSYSFHVEKDQGIQLAIPVQGAAVGLGLMGAQRAEGSVTLSDAYTYGIDIAPLYLKLSAWWGSDPLISNVFGDVVQTEGDIFLRVVSRVYLVKGVSLSLRNLDASGSQAGVGAGLELLDVAREDPESWQASADAYAGLLGALSGSSEGGGAFRFLQASERSVSMSEDFGRPLVVGYLGFDVPVEADGSLGVPIPSFTRLEGRWSIVDAHTGSVDPLESWTSLEALFEDGAQSVEVFEEDGGFRLRGWYPGE